MPDRYRAGNGRRVAGVGLALLVEVLLILALLTLGTAIDLPGDQRSSITSIAFRSPPEQKQAETPEKSEAPVVAPDEPLPTPKAEKPAEDVPAPPQPAAPAPRPVLIPVAPRDPPSATSAPTPRQPGPPAPASRSPMGPVNTGGAAAYADTARVGTAPTGEPLYAAAWYREPYQDELAGYLSTASGPGWGLIACRTAPNWKVENCVQLDEYPAGSRIAHAAAAAAWQFQVRPPRVGGVSKVGEWVRIRIDYGVRPRPAR